jgi:uncharacterized protein YerC
MTDSRRIFNANAADGITSAPMRAMGYDLDPTIAYHSPQSSAAFLTTLDAVEYQYFVSQKENEFGTFTPYIVRYASALFSVNESLYLHSAYSEPRFLSISIPNNPDGTFPFETGKRYIVTGRGFTNRPGRAHINIEYPDVDFMEIELGFITTRLELHRTLDMNRRLMFGIDENSLPLEMADYVHERVPTAEDGHYSIFEPDDGFDGFNLQDNALMMESLDSVAASYNSFQILTTNDTNSLFRLNQRRRYLHDGRTFTQKESRDGAKVALVSRQFAVHNDLSVGDFITMRMYNAVLGSLNATVVFEEGPSAERGLWLPSLYSAGLEVSAPETYEIIGIYYTFTAESGDYAILPNTVIVPDKSVKEFGGEPKSHYHVPDYRAPLLSDALLVPNGRINEFKETVDGIAEGYGNLFRIYDQGYAMIMAALRNLRLALVWIFTLSAAGWAAVVFLFSMFYVAKKRKEAALLHCVGISKRNRFLWVFAQSAVVITLALGISIAVALPLYGRILEIAGSSAQEFTNSFRNLMFSDSPESGIRRAMPLDKSTPALLIAAGVNTLLLLGVSGYVSLRSVKFKSRYAGGGE